MENITVNKRVLLELVRDHKVSVDEAMRLLEQDLTPTYYYPMWFAPIYIPPVHDPYIPYYTSTCQS